MEERVDPYAAQRGEQPQTVRHRSELSVDDAVALEAGDDGGDDAGERSDGDDA